MIIMNEKNRVFFFGKEISLEELERHYRELYNQPAIKNLLEQAKNEFRDEIIKELEAKKINYTNELVNSIMRLYIESWSNAILNG